MCYYFDDIIKTEDFDLHNILIDEKSHESILVYNVSYKSFIDSKPSSIRFNKIYGFIRVYDGTRYVVLFGGTIWRYDSLPLEKTMTFNNVIILIKLVWNKDKNTII